MMPIQIKELIIRATVSPQPGSGVANSTNGSADSANSNREKIQEQTIRRCVDEVLDILRIQNER